jgi:RNA polymerase sigma factor (sigma-70 family)
VQLLNDFVQPRRKPAAATAIGRPVELAPTSSLDQLGLLVQIRLPSEDAVLTSFKQNIVPQLDAAYNFARFLSRDADAAQDIVQEAFLRAYRSFAGYRGGDSRAWIFTIVRNCHYSWLTDRRRKSRLEIDHHGEGDSEEFISNIPSDASFSMRYLARSVKYWFCAKSKSSPIIRFRISQHCRLALSCRVWRARERHLGMSGAARQNSD